MAQPVTFEAFLLQHTGERDQDLQCQIQAVLEGLRESEGARGCIESAVSEVAQDALERHLESKLYKIKTSLCEVQESMQAFGQQLFEVKERFDEIEETVLEIQSDVNEIDLKNVLEDPSDWSDDFIDVFKKKLFDSRDVCDAFTQTAKSVYANKVAVLQKRNAQKTRLTKFMKRVCDAFDGVEEAGDGGADSRRELLAKVFKMMEENGEAVKGVSGGQ